MSKPKIVLLNWDSLMKRKIRKIQTFFDIESWIFCTFLQLCESSVVDTSKKYFAGVSCAAWNVFPLNFLISVATCPNIFMRFTLKNIGFKWISFPWDVLTFIKNMQHLIKDMFLNRNTRFSPHKFDKLLWSLYLCTCP